MTKGEMMIWAAVYASNVKPLTEVGIGKDAMGVVTDAVHHARRAVEYLRLNFDSYLPTSMGEPVLRMLCDMLGKELPVEGEDETVDWATASEQEAEDNRFTQWWHNYIVRHLDDNYPVEAPKEVRQAFRAAVILTKNRYT